MLGDLSLLLPRGGAHNGDVSFQSVLEMCGDFATSSHKMADPRVCLVRSYIRLIRSRYTCSTCSRSIFLLLLIFSIR